METPPLPWTAHSNAWPLSLCRYFPWYPIWASRGTSWGHFLSPYLQFLTGRDRPHLVPPSFQRVKEQLVVSSDIKLVVPSAASLIFGSSLTAVLKIPQVTLILVCPTPNSPHSSPGKYFHQTNLGLNSFQAVIASSLLEQWVGHTKATLWGLNPSPLCQTIPFL